MKKERFEGSLFESHETLIQQMIDIRRGMRLISATSTPYIFDYILESSKEEVKIDIIILILMVFCVYQNLMKFS